MRNSSECLECHIGALKAWLVRVNTNYRYVDEEVVHRWNDAAAAVMLHAWFAEVVAGEPLHRVHECFFGVLAMESEPVDPRL